ncbi:MAG: Asp23/Gls24 family envelope stress response protein [Thermotogaceae bacterium]|nr:Asp23/Gls24 family envelope stress response protein [Thermotogaceae bacterium]
MKKTLDTGELEILPHAIKKLAYFAVMESYGPVNIESDSFLTKFFGKEEEKIKVEELDENTVQVDLFLDLEFGVKITEVARNIIDNVSHKIRELGGIEGVIVNVYVTGVK